MQTFLSIAVVSCIWLLVAESYVIPSNRQRKLSGVEKISKGTIEFSISTLKALLKKNETNPFYPTYIGLSGELALVSKVKKTKRLEYLETCGLNSTFKNVSSAVNLINSTDVDLCYNAVNLLVVADNANVKDEFWMFAETYKYVNISKKNLASDADIIRNQLKTATNNTMDNEIDDFVELNARQQVVLASASSFREKFAVEFDANLTKNGTFYNDGHNATFVQMMRHKGEYKYYSSEKLVALSIPFEDHTGNSLFLLMSHPNQSLCDVLQNLTSDCVLKILSNMKYENVSVKIPKFKSSIHKKLSDMPQNTTQKFANNIGGLKLSEMYLISTLELNEEGVARKVISELAYNLIHFYLHRPFLYCILSKQNIVLFAGVINRL